MPFVGPGPDALDQMIAADAAKRTDVSKLWEKLVAEYKRGRSCISVFEEVAEHIRRIEMELADARAGKFAPVAVEALKMGPGDVGILIFNGEPFDVAMGMGRIIAKTLQDVDPNARVVAFDRGPKSAERKCGECGAVTVYDEGRELRILPGTSAHLELVALAYALDLYEAGLRLDGFEAGAGAEPKEVALKLFRTIAGAGNLDEAKAYLASQQAKPAEAAT